MTATHGQRLLSLPQGEEDDAPTKLHRSHRSTIEDEAGQNEEDEEATTAQPPNTPRRDPEGGKRPSSMAEAKVKVKVEKEEVKYYYYYYCSAPRARACAAPEQYKMLFCFHVISPPPSCRPATWGRAVTANARRGVICRFS